MLEHGGNLREAALRHGRPLADWLDLSTGINPDFYPVPALQANAWHRLPEPHPGFIEAAQAYYGAPRMMPVAGTQAAIQGLPRLRPAGRVVVSAPSYAEHAHCWRQAGHQVEEVAYDALGRYADDADVMVVCNPNNPTGALIAPEQLLAWAGRLAARGGWLVVDEAFGDTVPQASVARWSDRPGLIVLRSVGKFFGLAGLRLGFVAAEQGLLDRLAEWLGPWSVSGPAQEIGLAALSDKTWQEETLAWLLQSGDRLHRLLAHFDIEASGTALFQWWPERRPEEFAQHMAAHGIWVRLFPVKARGIRLGLPGNEAGWTRLQDALGAWKIKEKR
ncbi:threonine-phosphate decarboxylase CobD [Noviherbaspirillum sp. CPCC 100848]|uniref:threonine-phosphate decarboxylase n=1 Tax=Noviherbaspirillum album TaxID=3080276 RepID=A0ABU6JET0_9BURK|nr:threonine-phosphate decarboxylase CobD [Noviherbaspirillum sp. CPCC 100848]MEC4722176.1 threonine-phosphate decarboxylase CobD [Noviherbaspirillum sp. CPCC 100848]